MGVVIMLQKPSCPSCHVVRPGHHGSYESAVDSEMGQTFCISQILVGEPDEACKATLRWRLQVYMCWAELVRISEMYTSGYWREEAWPRPDSL